MNDFEFPTSTHKFNLLRSIKAQVFFLKFINTNQSQICYGEFTLNIFKVRY